MKTRKACPSKQILKPGTYLLVIQHKLFRLPLHVPNPVQIPLLFLHHANTVLQNGGVDHPRLVAPNPQLRIPLNVNQVALGLPL